MPQEGIPDKKETRGPQEQSEADQETSQEEKIEQEKQEIPKKIE